MRVLARRCRSLLGSYRPVLMLGRAISPLVGRPLGTLRLPGMHRCLDRCFSTEQDTPLPCPECSLDTTYFDGSIHVCYTCGCEWREGEGDAGSDLEEGGEVRPVDANGVLLQKGDSVHLVQDLKGKGYQLRKGLKVTGIRTLKELVDGHDISAQIPGKGTYYMKAKFLRKIEKEK